MLIETIKRERLEQMQKVEDKELNTLFQEVNKEFPNRYFLHEYKIEKYSFFGKKKEIETCYYLYALTHPMKGINELQILNLCNSSPKPLTKKEVSAFFYGLLNGLIYK